MARNRYFEDEVLESVFKGKMLFRVFRYAAPYKKPIITIFVFMVLMSIAALFPPILNRLIIDKVLPDTVSSPLKENWMLYAVLAITGIISIASAEVVFSFFRNRIMAKIGYSVVRDLRQDVYEHLLKMSFDYFDSRPAGKILVRLTNYIDELANMFSTVILGFIVDGAKIIIILLFLFVLSWQFALIILASIVPMTLVLILIHHSLHKRHRTARNKVSNRTAFIAENINGSFVTKSFNRIPLNMEIYEELNKDSNRAWRRVIHVNELFYPTIEFFWYLGVVLVYVYATYLAMNGGNISVGLITSLVLYLAMFNTPLNNIATTITQLATATSNIERIIELRETPPLLADRANAYPLPEIEGSISFDNVSFSYDGKKTVLENFCLDVPAGKCIALVGPTGGGKSTIINLIPRFYEATSGTVSIDGHNINDVTLSSLRSQIGVMMQDTFMKNGTIMDNIRYGNLSATTEQCMEAARLALCDEFIKRLPQGYDTVIGEAVSSLSVGERQLISFARTILSDPKILILDEATSSIDTETEEKIQSALENLVEGRTSFVIAHRLSTIKKADLILFIGDKGILEAGTFEQLMSQRGKFYRLATTQK